jgi:hypothetical protein
MDLDDGTQLTLEKDKGQWKGSVIGQSGNPQIYWGKTKNELVFNILKAQANATKKIREQNLKLKHKPAAVQPVAFPQPSVKQLSAEEIFEIKTQLDSNPDLALSNWFQKATGLTVQQLASLAQRGADAETNLTTEAVSRDFLARNSDYFGTDANFQRLVSYMAEYKLGKTVTDTNWKQIFNELASTGNYTVENLEEAFQDLQSIGKLDVKPKALKTPPPEPVVEPAPAPRPESRIVKTETRPRAAFGLRTSDVTPVAPAAQQAPSVEDLESLPDDQIAALLQGIKRQRAISRR